MTSSPVVVIIGPSGSGKSSVVRALVARRLVRVHPTWTTRPRRPDELLGCPEHLFVAEAAFEALDGAGGFMATARPFGLPYRYGLPPLRRSGDGRADVVMLRASVVARLAELVPDHVVFQIQDDPSRTAARLRGRHGGEADVRARIEDNEREGAAGARLADRVFVNRGALDALTAAVAACLPVRRAA